MVLLQQILIVTKILFWVSFSYWSLNISQCYNNKMYRWNVIATSSREAKMLFETLTGNSLFDKCATASESKSKQHP